MRILVVGAGAVGGYFGGRLLEAGCDVTFLVRERRAAELAAYGLAIESPFGDFSRNAPPIVLAGDRGAPFDLILLSCKAYSLDGAVAAMAPAVGPETAVLPLLNGMRHLDLVAERFGAARALGGQCQIAGTLGEGGRILHLNRAHELSFGEPAGGLSDRVRAIAEEFRRGAFEARASREIVLEMWEKWVFLSALAAGTCLMRAAVGDIVETPDGTRLMRDLFAESRRVAAANGFAPRADFAERALGILTQEGSSFTASMLRDIESGNPIESDHIFGDLIRRGEEQGALPAEGSLLRLAFTHLAAYEARQRRSAAGDQHQADKS